MKIQQVIEDIVNYTPTSELENLDKLFKKSGYEIRIVGGAVRDILLKKDPKDVDLATDATPKEMMDLLGKAGIKHIPTGIEHGTITAVLNNEPFEITTLRADVDTDGRRATVQYVTSWEEDAKRRDLTYNAMSMDLDGKIYDYFGGMDDLQNKVSKFVGDPSERIKEDYLRILRYFRFQGRISKPDFDKDTLLAIKNNVSGLSKISVERVWQEMSKMLAGENIADILDHMDKTGVLKAIKLDTQDTNTVIDKQDAIINLARIAKNPAIGKVWKMSNEEYNLLIFLHAYKDKDVDQKWYSEKMVDKVDRNMLQMLATLKDQRDMIKHIEQFKAPVFPVTGNDLISKGVKPGPQLGQTLKALRDKWKQSNFTASKDQLINNLNEGVGRIVKGVNTTPDVGPNEISKQAAKFGNKVDKDGRPPTLSKKVKGKSTNVLFNLGLAESTKRNVLLTLAKSKILQQVNIVNLHEAYSLNPNTEIYVDMDGVLADFFGEWAKIMQVSHYTQINKQHSIDDALQKIRDTDEFWLKLPLLPQAMELLKLIKKVKGAYNICSTPLADDPNSDPHKREWLRRNLSFFPPKKVYITHKKDQFAQNKDGSPNILIDDYGININAWEDAGGIGFKYKDHKFERTASAIKQAIATR